jgi:hypothetical protein
MRDERTRDDVDTWFGVQLSNNRLDVDPVIMREPAAYPVIAVGAVMLDAQRNRGRVRSFLAEAVRPGVGRFDVASLISPAEVELALSGLCADELGREPNEQESAAFEACHAERMRVLQLAGMISSDFDARLGQ